MLKILYTLSVCLMITVGVVHTILTPAFTFESVVGALWFAGAGLALIFVGFLNVSLMGNRDRNRATKALCHVANLMLTLYLIVLATVLAEPQAILALILSLIITGGAFILESGTSGRTTLR